MRACRKLFSARRTARSRRRDVSRAARRRPASNRVDATNRRAQESPPDLPRAPFRTQHEGGGPSGGGSSTGLDPSSDVGTFSPPRGDAPFSPPRGDARVGPGVVARAARRDADAGATAMPTPTRAVPGDVIAERGEAARGARVDACGRVRATTCGEVFLEDGGARAGVGARAPVVPRVGDVVFGRVTRVLEKAAHVEIAAVNGRAPRGGDFAGVVRRQDARAHAVDSVELERCFRAGDVVRAKVLSLGDARSFYLTTAGDDLGVVRATHGTSRATMLPIGWTEVQCPVTGEVEDRKVARVDE